MLKCRRKFTIQKKEEDEVFFFAVYDFGDKAVK